MVKLGQQARGLLLRRQLHGAHTPAQKTSTLVLAARHNVAGKDARAPRTMAPQPCPSAPALRPHLVKSSQEPALARRWARPGTLILRTLLLWQVKAPGPGPGNSDRGKSAVAASGQVHRGRAGVGRAWRDPSDRAGPREGSPRGDHGGAGHHKGMGSDRVPWVGLKTRLVCGR